MEKIQKVSLYFRWFFTALIILTPLFSAFCWYFFEGKIPSASQAHFGFSAEISPAVQFANKLPLISKITTQTKMLGFLVSLIPDGIFMLACFLLAQLFRLYEKGQIFLAQNVRCIRNLGLLLLIKPVLLLVYEPLLTFILTMNNPVGERLIKVSAGTDQIGEIALALVILLISWIMDEGRKLKEQEDYIVQGKIPHADYC
jgi:hypothetical protein